MILKHKIRSTKEKPTSKCVKCNKGFSDDVSMLEVNKNGIHESVCQECFIDSIEKQVMKND